MGKLMTKKRVIILGKGELAIDVADWFHKSDVYEIMHVVPVIPEPEWAPSFKKWAVRNKVAYIQDGRYKSIPDVKENDWEVDLVVSVFYDKIIKQWFIDKCKKIVNIHNAPLPKYRGVSPINWALKNKELEHGVTIHEITAGIDDGPIVAQVKFSIYPEIDEVIDVYKKCLIYGYVLFTETMPLIDTIKPRKQVERDATYYDSSMNAMLNERRHFTKKLSISKDPKKKQ